MSARVGGLNNMFRGSSRRQLRKVVGSMLDLRLADGSCHLVRCPFVIEHLDTALPSRACIAYAEQRERGA